MISFWLNEDFFFEIFLKPYSFSWNSIESESLNYNVVASTMYAGSFFKW